MSNEQEMRDQILTMIRESSREITADEVLASAMASSSQAPLPTPVAHLRRRPVSNNRRVALTFGWAAAVILLVVLATIGFTSANGRPSKVVPSLGHKHRAVLHTDFTLGSVSWVNADDGFALAQLEGCKTKCTDLVRTTDGGGMWQTVGPVPSSFCFVNCSKFPIVSELQFLKPKLGYGFGANSVFETTNGGRTWTQKSGRYVGAISTLGTEAIRVSYASLGCPGPCKVSVDEERIGANDWHTVSSTPIADHILLATQGAEDAYVAFLGNPAGGVGSAHGTLLVSHDAGVSWKTESDPCGTYKGQEFDTSAIASAPNSALFVLCTGRFTQLQLVMQSLNGGQTFVMRSLLQDSDFRQIAATSTSEVFVASPQLTVGDKALQTGEIWASSSGGARWTPVASMPVPQSQGPDVPDFLGFQTSTDGKWMGSNYGYETTDGGMQWSRLPYTTASRSS